MMQILSALSARCDDSVDARRRKNLLALSVASFLASIGFMVVMPLLPGLLHDMIADDAARYALWLGIAISISPLLTALTGPLWGAVGERFGRKAMIERSLVCVGIAIALLAFATDPSHVVVLRAIIGGLGGTSVAALAAITATTPRRELGPAVGMLQASQTAGAMVGPALGGALGAMLGMRDAFIVSGAVFVAALLLVHVMYRETGTAMLAEVPRGGARETTRKARLLGPAMLVILLAAFFVQFVDGGLMVLLPLHLEHLGANRDSLPWIIGLGLSVTYFAATVSVAVAGRLSTRRAPTRILTWALAASAVLVVPLIFAPTWWHFLGMRVLLAIVAGAAPTLAYAASATIATPEQRGKVVGLVSSAGILGWAASPIVSGAIAQASPALLLVLDSAIYLLLAGSMMALERGLFDRLSLPRLSLPRLLPSPAGLAGRLPIGAQQPRGLARDQRFDRAEVVAALKGAGGQRRDVILDFASRPHEWLPSSPSRGYDEAARYMERVPTILSLLRQGVDTEAIGRRLSPFGGRWRVDTTIDTAADLIATKLNAKLV